MTDQILRDVEDKLDELIEYCSQLEKENSMLKAKEDSWSIERKRLLEKNDIARTRVEAMIGRLRNLTDENA